MATKPTNHLTSYVPSRYTNPRLSAIAGDGVQNLRCALNYIVTALVDQSNARLTNRHAFPIYLDRNEYLRNVGPPGDPLKNGLLAGVKLGTNVIEQVQPYKRGADAAAVDPLWQIASMSNADKHREILTVFAIPQSGEITPRHNGHVIGEWVPTEITSLPNLDSEFEVLRLRFAKPFPTYLHADVKGGLAVGMMSLPFGDKKGVGVDMKYLRGMGEHVRMVVGLFEQL
jgi:hypothetical protein